MRRLTNVSAIYLMGVIVSGSLPFSEMIFGNEAILFSYHRALRRHLGRAILA